MNLTAATQPLYWTMADKKKKRRRKRKKEKNRKLRNCISYLLNPTSNVLLLYPESLLHENLKERKFLHLAGHKDQLINQSTKLCQDILFDGLYFCFKIYLCAMSTVPCEQWFLQAGRYATRETTASNRFLFHRVCASTWYLRQNVNGITSSCFAGNIMTQITNDKTATRTSTKQ